MPPKKNPALNAELLDVARHVEEERDEEKQALLSRTFRYGTELAALKLGMYRSSRGSRRSAHRHRGPQHQAGGPDRPEQVIESPRHRPRLRPVVLDQVGLPPT